MKEKIELRDYPGNAQLEHGHIKTFRIEMKPYQDHRMRTIRVWLPDDYDGKKRFPVLYMHDAQNLFAGHDRLEKWFVERGMGPLAQDGISLIIVGVDTSSTRFSELCPEYPVNKKFLTKKIMNGLDPTGSEYAAFIAEYLKPIIDSNFRTLKDTAHTGIGGASMGGLMSLDMILRYPETFGRALVFSPAFISFKTGDILARLDAYDMSRMKNHRIYMYNGGQTLDAQLTMPTIKVYNKLVSMGLTSSEIALVTDSREPHFEVPWAKWFPDAIRYLFIKKLPAHETHFDPEALKEYFDMAAKGE